MAAAKKLSKADLYEEALINIWKCAAVCWDGKRECSDSQEVAAKVVEKANPKLFALLDDLQFQYVKVAKNGRVTYPKRPTKAMKAK